MESIKKIGLIDVDGHNFPNLPLMKLSAWHKAQGDSVEWYEPLTGGWYDRIYMSKVFTFTPDYMYPLNSNDVRRGGTGYFYPDGGDSLPTEIEHIYPDYGLYGIKDTAYGFLTRGCPRGCGFCIVAEKEGRRSVKVADVSEFWRGQKHIKLLDPNLLACREHIELLKQLEETQAYIDFTQGLDIRLTNEENIRSLNRLRIKEIHFAWDYPKDDLRHYFESYKKQSNHKPHGHFGTVYCLTNCGSTLEEDLYRIYTLREMDFDPYVMIYEKDKLPRRHELRRLQRWCNNKVIFRSEKLFKNYRG